ncbi:hypothetical protein [Pigmentiphaga sp. D-2]|nr:hypothetical protein [Pigmentiphaga sp. D-2]
MFDKAAKATADKVSNALLCAKDIIREHAIASTAVAAARCFFKRRLNRC